MQGQVQAKGNSFFVAFATAHHRVGKQATPPVPINVTGQPMQLTPATTATTATTATPATPAMPAPQVAPLVVLSSTEPCPQVALDHVPLTTSTGTLDAHRCPQQIDGIASQQVWPEELVDYVPSQ